jgi:signal transduction histidine kinase
MKDELLAPLSTIIQAAEVLISDETDGIDAPIQLKFLHTIHSDAVQLYDVVVSLPDLTWERAKEVLSYESRSHLASIIGYAEILLDEADGPLTDKQKEIVERIDASGRRLLSRLSDMWD